MILQPGSRFDIMVNKRVEVCDLCLIDTLSGDITGVCMVSVSFVKILNHRLLTNMPLSFLLYSITYLDMFTLSNEECVNLNH